MNDQPRTSKKGMFSWAIYDWANNGFFTPIQTFIFAAYFTRSVAADQTIGTAQWGNMLAAAGLLVGLSGPFLGAVADQGGRRKPWIVAFTLLCVAATAMLWMVRPDVSWVPLALVMAGLGTVGAEGSMIFYNAMLPDLVPASRIGRWSGWGWGMGYVGGLLCLIISLYGFINEGAWFAISHEGAAHVRAICLLSAGWYLIFAMPLLMFTPDTAATGKKMRRCLSDAWRQLRQSIRDVRGHGNIVRFLIARMIYNDGLVTMFAFGGIYAAGTFGLSTKEVILFGIGLNVTAGIGAACFAWLDDRIGARPTIIISLLGLIVPGLIILLTTSLTMFWVFGLMLGIFVGPVQASSRSYLARVAPTELRAQMFGLFALSGKLTTFLGPLLVGWLTLASGTQRVGMSAIVAMFAIGALLMFFVPAEVNTNENTIKTEE